MKPSKSTAETTGFSISEQERAARDKALAQLDPMLASYIGEGGDVTSTPFYKRLLTTTRESTNRAYDNAQTAAARKAQMAGFGYDQPIALGAASGIEAERAQAEAETPMKVAEAAMQPQFQAAGMKESQAGMYQPTSYFGTAASAEQNRINQPGFWRTLAGITTGIGTKLIRPRI